MKDRGPLRSTRTGDYHVVVPAVMSAGALFSLAVLARDWLDRVRGEQHRREVVSAQASAVAAEVLDLDDHVPEATEANRWALGVVAAACLGFSIYLLPGAVFNYLRPGGYLSEIAWILALALVLVVAAGAAGIALARIALRPTDPVPGMTLTIRSVERLTQPGSTTATHGPGWGAAWHGTASVVVLLVTIALSILTLAVAMGDPRLFQLDLDLLDAVRDTGPGTLVGWADHLGRTEVALVASVVALLLVRRRLPRLAAAYPMAVALGIAANVSLKVVISRPRPPGPVVGTALPSYPSGHAIQAVILAVFVTLVVHQLLRRRWLTAATGAVMGLAATFTGIGRVVHGAHWPSDVVGGVLVGVLVWLGVALVLLPHSPPRAAPRPALVVPEWLSARARTVARVLTPVVLVGFAALSITVGVPRGPTAGMGAPSIEQALEIGLLGVAAIGAAVALRWEAAGATVLAVVGSTMALFASIQYPPTIALGAALALFGPAFLYWLAWQHGRPVRSLAATAVTAIVLCAGTWAGASAVYDHYLGPTHPASSVEAFPPTPLHWVITGALSADQVTVSARTASANSDVQILVATTAEMDRARSIDATPVDPSDPTLVRAVVDDLRPGTTYFLGVSVGGRIDEARPMRVRTPPLGASSFTVAFGACARTGSNGSVFDAIAELDPLLYLITGDLHYGDVTTPDSRLLRSILDRTLSASAQQALYLRTPIAYVWDDHDFGGNDSDARSPARESAQQTYRAVFPHAPLPSTEGIQQAFTIGRVRFILTDTRSYRVPRADGTGTLLGAEQLAWFEDELIAARDRGQAVVWVSPTPWIGPDNPASDTWAGFPQERRRIAGFIDENEIDGLLMLSGDAHMVAIDDGTNSGYSPSGANGFPVAHGGALDRPGSLKGGPYSEGAFPGSGQFGLLEIVDDGGPEVQIRVTGRDWRGDTLVKLDTSLPVRPG